MNFFSATRRFIIATVPLLLTACGSQSLEHYKDTQPTLTIEQFFAHKVTGYGMVKDYSGQVIKRFKVTMLGTWQGDTGILQEDFVYDNGEKQHNQWQLHKQDASHFTATAANIVGIAAGEQRGNAMHMRYMMAIPYQNSTLNLLGDDWFYRIDEHVVLNTTSLSKWGLPIAQVFTSFYK